MHRTDSNWMPWTICLNLFVSSDSYVLWLKPFREEVAKKNWLTKLKKINRRLILSISELTENW